MSEWIERHRFAWSRNAGLRGFYAGEIFNRIVSGLGPGPTLELGSGPGFFAETGRCDVVTDVAPGPFTNVVCDALALPFADGSFGNVVFIDVLHHLGAPDRALGEIARVLRPGGRLLFVEPWVSDVLGWFVYRYLHHEDCAVVADPWSAPFRSRKDPLDGNNYLPRQLLEIAPTVWAERCPHLKNVETEPFAMLSYLATGGFRARGAPASIVRALSRIERRLPAALRRRLALRVFARFERV